MSEIFITRCRAGKWYHLHWAECLRDSEAAQLLPYVQTATKRLAELFDRNQNILPARSRLTQGPSTHGSWWFVPGELVAEAECIIKKAHADFSANINMETTP